MQSMVKTAVVTGAGGFIGHHMVKYLKRRGYSVRGVDIKKPEYELSSADEFLLLDLREGKNAQKAVQGVKNVYNFAANMGGVGYIDKIHAQIMHDNLLININMLESSVKEKIERYFFSSSACVYPKSMQTKTVNRGLREKDAFPANPDTMYGWEKLTAEQLCLSYHQDYGLQTRIARFHNIYGPLGTWKGGREKSPAAICRKIAQAKDEDTIDVWGDGKQTRSYCYIDDCVDGVYALMQSDITTPLNIGSNRLVSINDLIEIVASVSKKRIHIRYDASQPQGVRGRNANIGEAKKLLQWKPKTSLEKGLNITYKWIQEQIIKKNLVVNYEKPN